MENPRTTAARDHDDSALIDAANQGPSQGGRSGHAIALDLATDDELARVDDPEGHSRVTKAASIDHQADTRRNRPRAPDAGSGEEEAPETPPNTVG